MTKLRDILEYVNDHGPVPFHALRSHFNSDLTGLRVAIDRNLLNIRADCYNLTEAGCALLASDTLSSPERKTCSDCGRDLEAAKFWKAPHNGDGLFNCCITCEQTKRRKSMERKEAAIKAVLQAGKDAVEAAKLWDEAVSDLAMSWKMFMDADATLRQHRNTLTSINDSGRLDARLTFLRASYALHLALNEAGFPQQIPLLREVQFPAKLADYIGHDPHLDYFRADPPEPKKKRGENSHGANA